MSENAIVALSDIEKMADAVVKSQLFGVKTKEQAIALMLLCQSEGIHPMKAVSEYHIIQGRPALKADAMMARFQRAGGSVRWNRLDDKEVSGTFSHAQGGEATINWTVEMATKAGLTGKDTWKQYPRQMLRSRVISEGVRTVFPGIVTGIYTPEEVADFDAVPIPDKTPKESVKEKLLAQNKDKVIVEAPTATDSAEPLSKDQYASLLAALKEATMDCDEAGKREVMGAIQKEFSVGTIADIPSSKFEAAMGWVKAGGAA